MYDVAIVREKGDLQVRARRFEFRWSSGALGGRCLLQKMTPKIEMLDQLTFSDDNV